MKIVEWFSTKFPDPSDSIDGHNMDLLPVIFFILFGASLRLVSWIFGLVNNFLH